MSTPVTFNGTTYSVPASGEVAWSALSSFLIALGNSSQTTNSQKAGIRVATSTPVTVVAATDYTVITNLTVAGAVAVTLPTGVNGQIFFISDGKGDANTNNITISGSGGQTINGSATYVINTARGAVAFQWSATASDWKALVSTNSGLTLSAFDSTPNANGATVSGQNLQLQPASASFPGGVSIIAQSFAGLKKFEGGESSVEYVGTNPEVGGSTPFVMTNAHRRVQNLNPAGAITIKLPTTSVKSGEMFWVINRSTNAITVQSSGANTIDIIDTGFIVLQALIDTPTAAADWNVIDLESRLTHATTFTLNNGGATTGSTNILIHRRMRRVIFRIPNTVNATSGTGSTSMSSNTGVPSQYRQATSGTTLVFVPVQNNSVTATTPGGLRMLNDGTFNIFRDAAGTAYTNSSLCGLTGAISDFSMLSMSLD